MSHSDSDKALAAEERSQATRSFVRRVRSATHKTPSTRLISRVTKCPKFPGCQHTR